MGGDAGRRGLELAPASVKNAPPTPPYWPADDYTVTDMMKLWKGAEVPANTYAATSNTSKGPGGRVGVNPSQRPIMLK
eukprot:CAMPEP_0197605810 /NCGR_PEP_ID=MMETSP1326-20131121/43832_1 /TAXON_ID=1155430 /ORGANISM="Genus nov. species nov., Strain RCC2288" /LENGTH=77 /DNA_ID=CAMNT_0043173659 /DNA_START=75 /DNA_END=305 /DNA_ORIENTATION=-